MFSIEEAYDHKVTYFFLISTEKPFNGFFYAACCLTHESSFFCILNFQKCYQRHLIDISPERYASHSNNFGHASYPLSHSEHATYTLDSMSCHYASPYAKMWVIALLQISLFPHQIVQHRYISLAYQSKNLFFIICLTAP